MLVVSVLTFIIIINYYIMVVSDLVPDSSLANDVLYWMNAFLPFSGVRHQGADEEGILVLQVPPSNPVMVKWS